VTEAGEDAVVPAKSLGRTISVLIVVILFFSVGFLIGGRYFPVTIVKEIQTRVVTVVFNDIVVYAGTDFTYNYVTLAYYPTSTEQFSLHVGYGPGTTSGPAVHYRVEVGTILNIPFDVQSTAYKVVTINSDLMVLKRMG